MQELRLATIGSGMIVHALLSHFKNAPGVTLEAAYSRSKETGEALARECGCKKVYTSLEAMLLDPAVNTVYIASPNLLHFAQAKQALEAGKNVICEKPFVPTRAQAQTLIDLAREKRLLLAEAVPTPYLPNFPVLRRLLPEIGQVRLVLANYTQYSARFDKLRGGEKPNIFNPALAGGCLMDINFYNVLLCCALFGKPEDVSYTANIFPGVGCDTSGIAVLKYPDFEWTDATAPAWNNVFDNGWATPRARSNGTDPKRTVEIVLGSYSCDDSGDLQPDVPLCFDVTDAIRAAKAAGESHITLHSATAGGDNWNFGIIPRERSQGVSCAAQIVFALKNWTVSGTVIMVR